MAYRESVNGPGPIVLDFCTLDSVQQDQRHGLGGCSLSFPPPTSSSHATEQSVYPAMLPAAISAKGHTVVCARLKVVIIQSPTTQLHHLVSRLTTVTMDCGSTSYPTNSLERQKVPHCGAYALYISSESGSARRWHQCGTLFWGKETANSRSIVLSHKFVKGESRSMPHKISFSLLESALLQRCCGLFVMLHFAPVTVVASCCKKVELLEKLLVSCNTVVGDGGEMRCINTGPSSHCFTFVRCKISCTIAHRTQIYSVLLN